MFLRRESIQQYIRLYPVNSLIIIANLVMWGLMEWFGSSTDSTTLLEFGALFNTPVEHPELWRFVTAMFLHIGGAHLFFNSFALYVFAPPLERMLGSFRYLFFYVMCGISGSIASYWLHSDLFLSAGASGAIYGVYAAYLYLALFRKDIIDKETKQTVVTILIIGALNSVIVPNIDLYAHAGGFVGGLILMALIALSIRRRRR